MSLNKYLLLILCGVLGACNPYQTKRINLAHRQRLGDSIYIVSPLVICKRQSNTTNFDEQDGISDVIRFTEIAVHQVLDNKSKTRYGSVEHLFNSTTILVDSVLKVFKYGKHKTLKLSQKLNFPTKAGVVLIPYIVWTRSTEDYDEGKCGNFGYRDFSYKFCTWTLVQVHLIAIDRIQNQVIYFNYKQWKRLKIWDPSQELLTRLLFDCSKPLLKKLSPVSARL